MTASRSDLGPFLLTNFAQRPGPYGRLRHSARMAAGMILMGTVFVVVPALCRAGQLPAAAATALGSQQGAAASQPRDSDTFDPATYSCTSCHRRSDIFFGDRDKLHVDVADLEGDIHWQKGIRCHDCHGGSPHLEDILEHKVDPDFVTINSPADIPHMCGRCHSDFEYMKRYNPSARTDQESEYWTSGHGQKLRSLRDPRKARVATCVDCHSHHGIQAVKDQHSPVYATNVAETCAHCHADEELMRGRNYKGLALGTHQYAEWRDSVHGKAMHERGDTSAPTCNDCHGNHGAVPPDVGSVANACGACHGKVADLFGKTRMKHFFDEFSLPGCAVCHGNHHITSPTDDMLGMGDSHLCADCHQRQRLGATPLQGEVGHTMWEKLKELEKGIADAEKSIEEAERLGMEVGGPRFDLRTAKDSLTNARSLIHTFSVDPVQEAVKEGMTAVAAVQASADEAMAAHTWRRIWLAISLVPIFLVVILLLLYIRTLEIPAGSTSATDESSAAAGAS